MIEHERTFEVRPRTDNDLDACVDLARRVRELDGYPPYLPDNDFRVLLTRPKALAAYVAVDHHQVVGHVALHASRPGSADALACTELGRTSSQLGVIARLFSAPTRRRAGVGRVLLETATEAARDRGLTAILDVWTELGAAISFYESCRWTKLGTIDTRLPEGRVLPEHVFAAP